jgi:hypothetical protein
MKKIPMVKIDLPGDLDEIINDNQLGIKERKEIYESLSQRSSNERSSNFNTAIKTVQHFSKDQLAVAIFFVRQCSQIICFSDGNCLIIVEPPFNALAYLFSAESGGNLDLLAFEKKEDPSVVSSEDILSFVRGEQQKEVWKELLIALRYFISGGHPK